MYFPCNTSFPCAISVSFLASSAFFIIPLSPVKFDTVIPANINNTITVIISVINVIPLSSSFTICAPSSHYIFLLSI